MRRPIQCLALALALSCLLAPSTAQDDDNINTRDAVLQARMRFLGDNVLPFTIQNQNAVISGISNVLQDGITASDIALTVLDTYDSTTAFGSRRLLEYVNRRLLQSTFPAVDVALNITTSENKAQNNSQTLIDASNQTYALASSIGQQGLQTQQIVVQSIDIEAATPPASAPPESSSPPPPSPSPSPPPPQAPAPQSPAESAAIPSTTPSATPSPAPSGTATGTGNSGSATPSSSSGGISTGAIVGIVVGAIILIALAAAFLLWRRRRSKQAEQADVLDYFSDVGKPAPLSSGPIVADSSRAAVSFSAPGQSAGDATQTGEIAEIVPPLGNGEKVEYTQEGEKTEVKQRAARPQSAFMKVRL